MSTTTELLGEYAALLNRFGPDSAEERDFMDAHRFNTEFVELANLSKKLKRALTSPIGNAIYN